MSGCQRQVAVDDVRLSFSMKSISFHGAGHIQHVVHQVLEPAQVLEGKVCVTCGSRSAPPVFVPRPEDVA